MLGEALLGQKKLAKAGPLLLEGRAGMRSRAKTIPPLAMARLTESAERLVRLYEALGKPDEAAKFRKEAAQDREEGPK